MSFAVEERTVIVTGGRRGIGYGIAEVFADAGAHVTIVGRDPGVAAQAVTRLADGVGATVHNGQRNPAVYHPQRWTVEVGNGP